MKARGFILPLVAFALALIAAVAYMLTRSGPMTLELASDDARSTRALKVAEAGMQHAIWRADHSSCTGYALPGTAFGSDNYSATFSAGSGSPVTVTVTANLADGSSRSLTRSNVAIHQAPSSPTVLQPNESLGFDTYLDQKKPTTNFGVDQTLYVNELSGQAARALFRFSLAAIPSGARILDAKLQLYQLTSGQITAGPLNVYAVTRSWNEGTGNGNNSYDATWQNRMTGSAWSHAGGDYGPDPFATAQSDAAGNVWLSWDVTRLVERWSSGEMENDGLMVKAGNGTASASFASSDNAATERPKLTITYACECGALCSGTMSATISATAAKVLFVVADSSNLDSDDTAKLNLLQDSGYTVTLLSDDASASAFTSALTNNNVAYVSESVDPALIGTKLLNTDRGVVYEEGSMNTTMGLSAGYSQTVGKSLNITDNTHEITQVFATGKLDIYRYTMAGLVAVSPTAPGGKSLASWVGSGVGLIAADTGAATTNGTAAGRRVMLPFGPDGQFDPDYLNNNGRTILIRSLDWASQSVADPLAQGMIAYWRMDDASGTIALDSVGGHNGTLVNGPIWSTGKVNGALTFDGSNDYVSVPNATDLATLDALSFSAWIYVPSFTSGYKVIISKDNSSGLFRNSSYWFGTKGSDLAFGYWNIGSWREIASSGLGLSSNAWHLVGASFDNATNQVVLYADGIPVATGQVSGNPTVNTAPVVIGKSPDNEYWKGKIDDLRMYNRVLSASEVARLYSTTGGGSCSDSFADLFNTAASYAGNDGSQSWLGDWQEINESDGAGAGDEVVKNDKSNYQLRIQNGNEGVMRAADLSAYSSAILSLDYRRNLLAGSSQYVSVQASADGTHWTELGQIGGLATDLSYKTTTFDLTPYISSTTYIRLLSSSSMNIFTSVWFDNVRISTSGCAP